MFGKNKRPVLTATVCTMMENLRLAIEVLTGQYVRFVHIDFNTGRGRVRIGSMEFNLSFDFSRDDLIHFAYHELDGWNLARFDKPTFGIPGAVWVINERAPREKKGHAMWWVGHSATDRWEEPLDVRGVANCAGAQGLTVQQYLNS